MNLAQVVWYSLAIGFSVFISLFTIAFISYKIKNNKVRIKSAPQRVTKTTTPMVRNKNLRVIPEKVAYVKKHSQIKETLSYSARMEEEKRFRNERMQPAFNPHVTRGRFTVVNETPTFSERNFEYIPSQVRSSYHAVN